MLSVFYIFTHVQYKFGRCKDGRRKILCFTTEW